MATRHFGVVAVTGNRRLPTPAARSSARIVTTSSVVTEVGLIDFGDEIGNRQRYVAQPRNLQRRGERAQIRTLPDVGPDAQGHRSAHENTVARARNVLGREVECR